MTSRPSQTKLCVSLTASRTDEALAAMRRHESEADLFELRLDYMDQCDLPALLADRPRPVIVTNRPVREGGRYGGDEASRLKPLLQAAELGAEHVDVEHDADLLRVGRAFLPASTRLIVSYHNFDHTPPDLWDTHCRLADLGADIVKLAVMAHGPVDCAVIFDVLRRATRPTICLGMGSSGLITRLLAPKFGAHLTFAAAPGGAGLALGQLPAEAMLSRFRFRDIGPSTKVIGYLGPEAHAWPHFGAINAAWRDEGQDRVAVPLVAGTVDHGLPDLRRLGVEALIVTEALSEAALAYADELTASARAAGRCNTVFVLPEGGLVGHQVDCDDEGARIAAQLALLQAGGLLGAG